VWKRVQTEIAAPAPPGPGGGLAKPITIAVAAFVAGGLTGAVLYARYAPHPPTRIVRVPIVVREPAPAPIATEAEHETPTIPPAPLHPIVRHYRAPDAGPSEPSDLARERAIIEVARTAIARGHIASAQEAIERHSREFPQGDLVEEREGLRVIALVRAGQREDAERSAARFRQRYPRSFLLPAVESALREPD
jgi:hypothetical protein